MIVPYPTPLRDAVLVRRYKRFLADVRWPDGTVEVVHCPNPGRMTTCAPPGAPCRVSLSDAPRRKLRATLEQVLVGDTWVHVHPLRSNRVVHAALTAGELPELADPQQVAAEVAFPAGAHGRADFRAQRGGRAVWIEVKSVTLAVDGVGRFPDAVSARGTRHLARLTEVVRAGDRGVLLLLAARADVHSVGPADDVDPVWGQALRAAVSDGVEVLARRCEVRAEHLALGAALPVDLR